jgi:hypothetical protein
MSITKSQLFRVASKVTLVDVSGFEAPIGVRSLSVAQVLSFVNRPADVDSIEALCQLVQVGICDEDGTSLFQPDELGEVKTLDFATLNALAQAVLKTNKLGKADDEDLAKNSPAIPSA